MPTLDVSPVTEPSASDIARAMLSAHIVRVDTDTFRPMSVALKGPLFDNTIPTSIGDLPESDCRCYDLSVTAALQLNIPVIGSVSGGFGRRVVVSERCALKRITQDGIERDYGYAIRMCVTVDRWNADFKVNIPFLAASAQLGVIEASWLFQVVGLTGPKIDLNLPPTNLDVETFVIAKQSL